MTDAVVRDPGLQPERTALAWNRTGLTVTVNALLATRAGIVDGQPAFLVVGAVLFLAAAGAVVYGAFRRRELRRDAPVVRLHPVAVAAVTGVTLAAAVAGIASVVAVG